MTRDEKVEKIVNSIDSWDLDTIMEYVKAAMSEDLSRLSGKMLNEYYRQIYQDCPDE